MKYLLKKTLKWIVYLAVTVLFFSLPVLIERCEDAKNLSRMADLVESESFLTTGEFFFDFDPASVQNEVVGDSTSVRVLTKTDTCRKSVYLYVNGKKQDMVVVSDSTPAYFPRVYLIPGQNEIEAVLLEASGRPMALRKMRIFSLKRM